MGKIKKTIKFLITLINLRNLYWAKVIISKNIPYKKIKIKNNCLIINKYNLEIKGPKNLFLLDSIHYLDLLSSILQAKFIIDNSNFYIYWDDIKLNITTNEEFFIVSEIFLQKIYNVMIDRPCIVIDIGFNVGIASIFFAKNDNVKKVYAFEPVDETYEQGKINLGLNKDLATKIIAQNYGISNKDEERIINYSYNNKGSIGKYGMAVPNKEDIVEKKIKLKSFVNEYEKIVQEINNDNEIIIKIDCEGDEYDIIESLKSLNKKLPIIILIEWHKKGPDQLINDLKPLGYNFLSLFAERQHRGNLYCFKNENIISSPRN